MLNKIKALADEAIALQNKNRMDEVLREISALCEQDKPHKTMVAKAKIAECEMVVQTDDGKVKPAKGAKNGK